MGSGLILGIETSCDETAAAVVERGARILSSAVASQIATHAPYGGVVPELASREHLRAIVPVVREALARAAITLDDLDAIAVTSGPGLAGALLVGITYAKALAFAQGIPLIAVNHLEGHIHAVLLREREEGNYVEQEPALALVVSGGHTHLYLATPAHGTWSYRLIGRTLDDAAGEAYDKVAKLLGLGYPGGPQVEKEALAGNPARFALPRPMHGRAEPDFSLSGLKTALRLEAEKIAPLTDQDVADLCASFQQAVVDVVFDRLRAGLRLFRAQYGAPTALVAAGGVAANQAIRKVLHRLAFEVGTVLVAPPLELCTDNGAMIAWAGCERLALGLTDTLDVNARARWPLSEVRGAPSTSPHRAAWRS